MIGQYTQLVWANTRYVGCGISIFLDIQSSTPKKKFYSHRLVCNYGPTGNVLGRTVYQKGVPCSKCAWGQCDVFRTSLCLNKDVQKDSEKDKTVLNRSCFSMIQGGNSTEVINLLPRYQLTNMHITIRNNKKHVVFGQDANEKQRKVRLKRSLNLTHSSQEHQSSPKSFVNLLYTTKIVANNDSTLSVMDPEMLDMPGEATVVNNGSSLVSESIQVWFDSSIS
nr:unnamed protein product [Callosobruchus analis]